MFKRIDKLLIPLPTPKYADPESAAAVQELLGGKFGEMSTLNNYLFQSFNFRQKNKLRPFYDLVSSITAEEIGHVELVSNTINLLLQGSTRADDVNNAPMEDAKNFRNTYHFIASAQTSLPIDSMGKAWSGDNVFSSGNLLLDFLHNFFLECGARTHKMRVYEMTSNPVAREMIGYLLVRGGVHVLAYAKGIQMITGTDVTKLLPIPNLKNDAFITAKKFEQENVHTKLYRFSDDDYKELSKIWKGTHPQDGKPLVVESHLPVGGPIPEFESVTEEFAPGIGEKEFAEIYKRLARDAGF